MELSTRTLGSGTRSAALVHGASASSEIWRDFAAILVDSYDFTVTLVDLRGHGDSPRADRYRVSDFVGDLVGHAPDRARPPGRAIAGRPGRHAGTAAADPQAVHRSRSGALRLDPGTPRLALPLPRDAPPARSGAPRDGCAAQGVSARRAGLPTIGVGCMGSIDDARPRGKREDGALRPRRPCCAVHVAARRQELRRLRRGGTAAALARMGCPA